MGVFMKIREVLDKYKEMGKILSPFLNIKIKVDKRKLKELENKNSTERLNEFEQMNPLEVVRYLDILIPVKTPKENRKEDRKRVNKLLRKITDYAEEFLKEKEYVLYLEHCIDIVIPYDIDTKINLEKKLKKKSSEREKIKKLYAGNWKIGHIKELSNKSIDKDFTDRRDQKIRAAVGLKNTDKLNYGNVN